MHVWSALMFYICRPLSRQYLQWQLSASGERKHVFSAFGFVHKITTFEKTAGFQALVQFSDSETASSAKNALDGRCIPSYLLPEHMGPCTLRITYSAHTDLSVKFQSHRSRDYTNPYLPVAPSAIDGSGQVTVGLDGKKLEPESNVLLASIENMQYAVTLDVLHMVFSAFGPVQKIAMFDKNGGVQALIQYPDVQTAVVAKEALEGHCIYDGGFCKLHISYSRHTDLSIKAVWWWAVCSGSSSSSTHNASSTPCRLGSGPWSTFHAHANARSQPTVYATGDRAFPDGPWNDAWPGPPWFASSATNASISVTI
ncbi:RRM_8 domain-containing protein, partial [Psidium guajava]